MSADSFNTLVLAWILLAVVIFPFVLKYIAPYGRHTKSSWGPLINNKAGWIIMESPALLVFSFFFLSGINNHNLVCWLLYGFWMIHYLNRTLIFPFRIRTKGKKIPISIVLMAFFFNIMNGYINGYFLGTLATQYDQSWLYHPLFLAGLLIGVSGMVLNWQSDSILIGLRKPGEEGYKIPRGGLFEFVSCPNHFSEILEWIGFAMMAWSLPGFSFVIWSIINLLPRALHHHKWYKATFSNYPPERKALIPFIL